MARIANATTETEDCEIEITLEMIEAGADIISSRALDVVEGWVQASDVSRAVLMCAFCPKEPLELALHDSIAAPLRVSVPEKEVLRLLVPEWSEAED
jgi:hypothetical protein